MKTKYLASLAIASALMVAACAAPDAPSTPAGETQTDVADPCAGVDPCAADPCAGVDPCAADPCAGVDPCAADPCAADPCAAG